MSQKANFKNVFRTCEDGRSDVRVTVKMTSAQFTLTDYRNLQNCAWSMGRDLRLRPEAPLPPARSSLCSSPYAASYCTNNIRSLTEQCINFQEQNSALQLCLKYYNY